MTTKYETERLGRRDQYVAAYARMISFTGDNHQKWPLFDAKTALIQASKDYDEAAETALHRRPKLKLKLKGLYGVTEHWENVVEPAQAELDRVKIKPCTGGPDPELLDAIAALDAAKADHAELSGEWEKKFRLPSTRRRFRAMANGVIRTGKTKIIDGLRVPVVEKVRNAKG